MNVTELVNGNYILEIYLLLDETGGNSGICAVNMKEKIFDKERMKEVKTRWSAYLGFKAAIGAGLFFKSVGYFDKPVGTH